jgi:hypothetical protein
MAVFVPPEVKAAGGIPNVVLAILGILLIAIGVLALPVTLARVEIAASPIAHVGAYAITNSQLTGILSLILLAVLFGVGTRSMALVPTGLQNLVEAIVEGLVGLAENVAGKAKGREFFALFATIFLYVLANNWLELLPGFTNGTIYVGPDKTPLFRSPSADLNFTPGPFGDLHGSVLEREAHWLGRLGQQVHQFEGRTNRRLRRNSRAIQRGVPDHFIDLSSFREPLRRRSSAFGYLVSRSAGRRSSVLVSGDVRRGRPGAYLRAPHARLHRDGDSVSRRPRTRAGTLTQERQRLLE